MRRMVCLLIVALANAIPGSWACAQSSETGGNAQVGRAFAVDNCSECHQVVPRKLTDSRVAPAPDFDRIASVPGTTAKSLYVFLHTPHPSMPNLVLSDTESANVIAYILSLKKRSQ